ASGCGEQVAAIKAVAKVAKTAAKQAERAKEAESAEKAQAAEAADEDGTTPANDPAAAAEDPAAALALAAQKMQQQGALRKGPVVNWRKLIGFLPDEIGGFTATGDAKGTTTKMAPVPGAAGTEVRREYRQGDARARVTIVDTTMSPALLSAFKLTAGMEEDSSDGYTKGTTIAGHPARVEWKARSKQSTATVLVGDRYLVTVRVRNTSRDDDAAKLAAALDLAGIAAVEPDPA
ncbi:MAG: hypothetical protein D6705_18630, partial [Deltaproteobacteria bacterium]